MYRRYSLGTVLLGIIFCTLLSACSTQPTAASPAFMAGAWQTTTQFSMPDMPKMSAQMTPQMTTHCLDTTAASLPLQTLAKRINSDYTNASCHSRYTPIDKNSVSWQSTCQTPPSRLKGTLTRHDAEHYSAHIKITTQMTTFVTRDARRTGACH